MPSTLTFTAPPSMIPLYIKCLMPKTVLKRGQSLPQMSAKWSNARANLAQVEAYRAVCGFQDDEFLPLLYPYVLTAPIQMSLMCSKEFPLKPLGSVHLRNHVLQHRAILPNEAMDVDCVIGASRVAKQGLEYDITTTIAIGGDRVWECVSTYLTRGKFGEPDPAAGIQLPELEKPDTEMSWQVASDMGRRYAKVTGDYNVIHISSPLAKLFGFPKAIIHGMWSAAKCLSNLPAWDYSGPTRYLVAFKGPIPMGSKVVMKSQAKAGECRMDAYCGGNPRPCVCALLCAHTTGEPLVP